MPSQKTKQKRSVLAYLADAIAERRWQPSLSHKAVQMHDAATQLLRVVIEVRHEALDRADDNGNKKNVDKAQADYKRVLHVRLGLCSWQDEKKSKLRREERKTVRELEMVASPAYQDVLCQGGRNDAENEPAKDTSMIRRLQFKTAIC